MQFIHPHTYLLLQLLEHHVKHQERHPAIETMPKQTCEHNAILRPVKQPNPRQYGRWKSEVR